MSILQLVPMEGLLDLIGNKSGDVTTTIGRVAGAIAVFFLVYKTIEGRFGFGRIILSLLAAGLFLWAVANVDTIQKLFKGELNGSASVVVAQQQPSSGAQPLSPGTPTQKTIRIL